MNDLRFTLIYGGGTETVLVNSPDGWDDALINRVRSDSYFSISEKVTAKLPFPLDGMQILKTLFYTYGFEAYCQLRIEQLVDSTQLYTVIFAGLIDFSTFNDNVETVDVICSEGSFWEKLKANENTEYEIDIDTYTPITINAVMTGVRGFSNYQLQHEYYSNQATGYRQSIGVNVVSSKTLNGEVVVAGVNESIITTPYFTSDSLFRVISNINTISYKLTINGYITSSSTGNIRISLQNFNGSTNLLLKTFVVNFTGSLVLVNFNMVDYVNLINGIQTSTDLFLCIECDNGIQFEILDTSILNLYYYTSYSKQIKALRPIKILESLLKQINNGTPVPLDTTFLTAIENYLITSGDAVRGLTGSRIKTTFKDFYESMNKIFSVGFGFESPNAVLREKSYFFKNELIKNIGEVANFKLELYKTHIINSLKCGYEEQTYDDVNGRFEVNQTQQWTLPIAKINKSGDFICKYRTDPFGILFTSLNLEGKITTDSGDDNDTFILHSTVTGSTAILNREYISALYQVRPSGIAGYGFIQEVIGAFNVSLTPKRNLLRQGAFINSFLHKLPGTSTIQFQTASKNKDFTSRLNSELTYLKESDPIEINTLPSPLFQPYLFSFDAVVSKDFNAIINANQNGYIQFTWQGVTLKGFINDISVNPASNSTYNFKLISHPSNDLTQLI